MVKRVAVALVPMAPVGVKELLVPDPSLWNKIEFSMLIQLSRSSSVQALYYVAVSGTYMSHGMWLLFHRIKKINFFSLSQV